MANYYHAMEGWLKRAYRQGLRFQHFVRRLEESGSYSPVAMNHYHGVMLQRIVRHCYRNVPYYTDLFNGLKLKPEDIQSKADLVKLPLLDKITVQNNLDKLIDKKRYNLLCKSGYTSGSTGTPSRFIRDFDAINFESAAVWRQWRQLGDDGKRRVTIRGERIIPMTQNEPPFWRHNSANNELLMCGYHLSYRNSQSYIETILDFQPRVLYSSPSMAHLLAKFFRHHGVSYGFDMVFTSSETLTRPQRDLIEETFQTRVYDWYGQAERVAAISQCAEGTYHIVEDYSLVETLPADIGPDCQELVGTHLQNFVMPLLRYRTQDYVKLRQPRQESTCDCGLLGNHVHHPVMPLLCYPASDLAPDDDSLCACRSSFRVVDQIIGRTHDYLLTPEGNHIFNTTHIFDGIENLLEAQFYQEQQGEVTLNVVTGNRFSNQDRQALIQNILAHTSPRMKIEVREVEDIPRGANGKFHSIVNRIPASDDAAESRQAREPAGMGAR